MERFGPAQADFLEFFCIQSVENIVLSIADPITNNFTKLLYTFGAQVGSRRSHAWGVVNWAEKFPSCQLAHIYHMVLCQVRTMHKHDISYEIINLESLYN